MAEYISRDKAIDAVKQATGLGNTAFCDKWDAMNRLRLVPAADVVARDCFDRLLAENDELRKERPAGHGRWMTTDAFPHRVYCSECNQTYIPNDRWQVWKDKYGEGGLPRDYCPNCGARMEVQE